MSGPTAIEWTDRTWNPIRGCSRISEGCRNCYAERIAGRFSGPSQPFEGFATGRGSRAHWTGKVELIESALTAPFGWRKPCRIFVNSMSDLFHEALPLEAIAKVFRVMWQMQRHTFQVLTKRSRRIGEVFRTMDLMADCPPHEWDFGNVWMGVSVENTEELVRVGDLIAIPAPVPVRFLSLEPLLDDIADELHEALKDGGIHWVIVGGESGIGARRCDLSWVRGVRDVCRDLGIALFVKQLGKRPCGEWGPGRPPSHWLTRIGGSTTEELSRTKEGVWDLRSQKGGHMDTWPEDLRIREFPPVRSRALEVVSRGTVPGPAELSDAAPFLAFARTGAR